MQQNDQQQQQQQLEEQQQQQHIQQQYPSNFHCLPLELHWELFSWLQTVDLRRMMPNVCLVTYALNAERAHRKWTAWKVVACWELEFFFLKNFLGKYKIWIYEFLDKNPWKNAKK